MEPTDGEAEFARERVQLFIDSGDAALGEIRIALERDDLAGVGRAAHAFKGSNANMCAPAAAAAAGALEDAAKGGERARLPELESRLRVAKPPRRLPT